MDQPDRSITDGTPLPRTEADLLTYIIAEIEGMLRLTEGRQELQSVAGRLLAVRNDAVASLAKLPKQGD